jgi:LCP family protein required for cell wall assembly
VVEKAPYRFHPFKIRTLRDQRFLMGWTLAGFIVSLALTRAFEYLDYVGRFIPPPGFVSSGIPDGGTPQPAEIPPWEVFGTDKLTFILLGHDEVDEFAHRSDTLMVGAVDFYARKIRILSIPRDTLVYIPRYGFMKVNSAYALGADDLVRRTVEGFVGVDVDYVISINYRGFVQVVDSLGGVDMTVERAMHYDDRRGNTHIHIDAGEHHFDGEQALNYARFRHDAAGDLGRIERQQKLMLALFNQAIKPANWTRIKGVADTLVANIGVSVNHESPRNPPDIGAKEVFSLIGFLTQIDAEDIAFYQVPTSSVIWGHLDCLRPIYSETKDILDKVFADDAPIGWKIRTPLPVADPGGFETNTSIEGGPREE